MVGGVTSAIAPFFLIIVIGMLVSSLLLAGTIATMLSYGAELATPTILYPVALIAATLIGVILGSSFTTVAGLGVPFVALAPLMGLSPEVAAQPDRAQRVRSRALRTVRPRRAACRRRAPGTPAGRRS